VKHQTPADTSEAVDQFMAKLKHPRKAEIEALRALVLAAGKSVAEGIKWNAPSYRTTEYFATTHLRAKRGIGLILHLGAKARDVPAGGLKISDPAKLLKWLGRDRAAIEFEDLAEINRSKAALQAVLRQWIRHV
jgi:hypothetical protein